MSIFQSVQTVHDFFNNKVPFPLYWPGRLVKSFRQQDAAICWLTRSTSLEKETTSRKQIRKHRNSFCDPQFILPTNIFIVSNIKFMLEMCKLCKSKYRKIQISYIVPNSNAVVHLFCYLHWLHILQYLFIPSSVFSIFLSFVQHLECLLYTRHFIRLWKQKSEEQIPQIPTFLERAFKDKRRQ